MPEFPEALSAEHLLDAHIDLHPGDDVGATPSGRRIIINVQGGTFEGPRLRGEILPGGGDWLVRRSDGVGELDVRATMRTDDGALIYLHYTGVLKAAPDIMARVLAGEDLPSSSYFFRTQPRFEAGEEKYGWLNDVVAVGYGYFGPDKVGYRLFSVL